MMSLTLPQASAAAEAAMAIRARLGGLPLPTVALVLGSGLDDLADAAISPTRISYADLPGFPRPTVAGHAGELLIGRLGTRTVAVLRGRAHVYEDGRADAMAAPIEALAELGCRTLILTNAAGSLRPEVAPGRIMQIVDHINLTGRNPLIGATGDGRFVDLVDAYDPGLRKRFRALAAANGISLAEGVYMWFVGPSFETPAEIRAAGVLGADAVGMSTVPEVILARALGLRVAAFSLITNAAAGMAATPLSHAQTLSAAQLGAASMKMLISAYLEEPE